MKKRNFKTTYGGALRKQLLFISFAFFLSQTFFLPDGFADDSNNWAHLLTSCDCNHIPPGCDPRWAGGPFCDSPPGYPHICPNLPGCNVCQDVAGHPYFESLAGGPILPGCFCVIISCVHTCACHNLYFYEIKQMAGSENRNCPHFCGDGMLEPPEVCDLPNIGCPLGTFCLNCKACVPPHVGFCGDGIVGNSLVTDGTFIFSEQCDFNPNAPNTCLPGYKCGANCLCYPLHLCGDGRIDHPFEQCDPPGGNQGCGQGKECVECICKDLCGNGVVDKGEQCDGNQGCGPGGKCMPDCTCENLCGNGVLDEGEQCDGNQGNCGPDKWCNEKCVCDAPPPDESPAPCRFNVTAAVSPNPIPQGSPATFTLTIGPTNSPVICYFSSQPPNAASGMPDGHVFPPSEEAPQTATFLFTPGAEGPGSITGTCETCGNTHTTTAHFISTS